MFINYNRFLAFEANKLKISFGSIFLFNYRLKHLKKDEQKIKEKIISVEEKKIITE